MAESVLVDAGFLVALLSGRDRHHPWAVAQAQGMPQPWRTCDAVLSEAFHLLRTIGAPALTGLLRRGAVIPGFESSQHLERVLTLTRKYQDVPMSFADACLVCMTETFPEAVLLTTDTDFRIYRRHGRQVIPARLPNG